MAKEYLVVCLRNPAQQHKGMKHFCNDMKILLFQANEADDAIIKGRKIQLTKWNTLSLLTTIRLILNAMLRYLHQIFSLEMVRLEELP